MSLDPEKFQGEVMKWAAQSFPKAQKHQPLLLLVEAAGDLNEVMSEVQDVEAFKKAWPEIADAVGDAMISLAFFCGMNGFELTSCSRDQEDCYNEMLHPRIAFAQELHTIVGRLAGAFLRDEQGIRLSEPHRVLMAMLVGQSVQLLSRLCGKDGRGLLEVTETAWAFTQAKNWSKYPKTGFPPAPAQVQGKLFKKGDSSSIPKDRWSQEVPF